MIRFKYRSESSARGAILRPIADVVLEVNRVKVELAMYIDSGADLTMIPLRFGRALGFRQLSTDTILEIKGISGSGVPYIVKPARLIIGEYKIPIRLAWTLMEEVPLLLGRMDVFRHFKIVFHERAGWVSFHSLR